MGKNALERLSKVFLHHSRTATHFAVGPIPPSVILDMKVYSHPARRSVIRFACLNQAPAWVV